MIRFGKGGPFKLASYMSFLYVPAPDLKLIISASKPVSF